VSEEPIPLAQPVLGEAEERAVLEVLRSGRLSLGPAVPAFEEAFAARLGVAHASAVSSGTAGLHLALRAVGVSEGDEVVTTPFSFVASANAIVYERARPVFADIDPVTLNLDPQAAAAAVTDRTTALLPVHIFGYPADLPAFEAMGLPIVEDACEALGAVHADGVPVGGRGHPSAFAFYANKQITTGEGGMVTTGDRAVKDRLDSERNQGRALDMGWLDHDRLGFNYRLSDIACALGLAQLERLAGLLADRARVAGWYRQALTGIEGLDLLCEDRGAERRGWFVYVVLLPADADQRETIAALAARGIQTRPYLPPIHLMSYYRETFGHREGEFPVCEAVGARSVALPFFPRMTEAQVAQVAEALGAVLGARQGART
jgi:perosamine synthetase